jgi:PmbA protein
MTDSFADLLQSVLSDTLKSGAEAADVRLSRNASLAVEVRKGGLESVEREESCGIALRALIGRRQASVSGSDLSSGGLRLLSERVVAMAKQAPEDRYCGLAAPAEIETHPVDLDLDCDDTPEAGELERRAAEMEAVAMAVPGVRQVEHCGASWSTSETWLAASNGFAAQKTSGISSMAVMAIAERDGSMERDYESSSERRRALLKSPEWVGRQAAIRATARLGARKVDSQTVPVIFENRLASRLIGAVIGAISGPAIARGVSFLKDRMNKQVLGSGVHLIDDPKRPGGFASRSFDGEGRPVRRTALIEDGVLTQWLLNGPSARQLGLQPNGFASMGFGDPPGVTTSNLDLQPGSRDLQGLMADAGAGLLVTDMFGPSLNPNTGDYSVGVSGFWFEKGERAYPVSEVTVAGDLRAMLLRAVPGSDLEIRSATNSPSLLIDAMQLAGR